MMRVWRKIWQVKLCYLANFRPKNQINCENLIFRRRSWMFSAGTHWIHKKCISVMPNGIFPVLWIFETRETFNGRRALILSYASRLNDDGECYIDVRELLRICGGRATGVGVALKAILLPLRPILNSGRRISWDKAYVRLRKRTGGASCTGWYDIIEVNWNR